MTEVHVVLGRDLAGEDLQLINYHRKLEFNSQHTIVPSHNNDDWDKPYFLVRSSGKLVAFGRLHNIEVEFSGVRYEILGIATVIAIVKHTGFGQLLMSEMKRYIRQSGKTAIGFCDPKVSGFYEKCGFSILRDGKSRFLFIDHGKAVPPPHPRDYALYLDGQDQLMDAVSSNPREVVTAYRKTW